MGQLTAARSVSCALDGAAADVTPAERPGLWDLPTKDALRRAARRSATLALFGWGPVVLTLIFLLNFAKLGVLAYDFKIDFWRPGHDLLHAVAPYIPQREAIERYESPVYPPPILLAAAPLSLLPFTVAAAIWASLMLAAAFAALWILGVRDWRCYGLLLISTPLFEGVAFGNVTPLLLLPLAAAWRFRDKVVGAALAVASAIVVKLFLWPLLVWLVVTRRWRAAVGAVAAAATAALAGWAVLGFAGLETYPLLLRRLSDVFAAHSVSLYAEATDVGLSSAAATVASSAVGLALLGLAFVLARRRDGDRRSLAAALAATIALSPIVWPHYLVLAFVPIALVQPRLGWLWAVPLATWPIYFLPAPPLIVPGPAAVPRALWQTLDGPVSSTRIAICLVPFAVVLAATLRMRGRGACLEGT